MSKELSKIKGVGPSAIEKLSEANISTIEELAKAKITELTKIKGIGKATAGKWISQAKDLSNGSSSTDSQKQSTSKSISTQKSTAKPKSTSRSAGKKTTTTKKASRSQQNSQSSSSVKSKPAKPEFTDTAKPIPSFILDRLSKKAKKVLNLSFTALKKMDLKDLQKSQKYLAPERIKFDPAFEDEKNALLALDEKVRFIENLIINFKDNQADMLVEEYVANPMKEGEFDEYTNSLGDVLGPEECAIRIYDNLLSKKAKKNYPFTETSFIRLIEKVIKKLYPEKVKHFQGK